MLKSESSGRKKIIWVNRDKDMNWELGVASFSLIYQWAAGGLPAYIGNPIIQWWFAQNYYWLIDGRTITEN